MRLVTEWFGTFLIAGDRSVDQVLFPAEAPALAERLGLMSQGRILDEERALAARAPEGGFEVGDDRLAAIPGARRVPFEPQFTSERAEGFGYSRDLLHAASLLHARHATRAALARPDAHVVMAVDALDDLNEATNLLSERLREWFGLHDPEAARLVERHEELAGLISAHTQADAVRKIRPDLPENMMGGPLPPAEEDAIRRFARVTSTLYATRAEIDKYLDTRLPEIAPNVTKLVGAAIAARLLKLAGGLQRLARMPSGTIQTLGAEKALFRHLKEGARPPKHGVILQHPVLHRAPRHQRGTLARALAAKIALAARADAFTRSDIADKLAADLEREALAVRQRGGGRRERRGRPGPGFRGRS